ncbi:MAG: ABC transporter permease [Parasporobacterium sp.]|nr:ABC transporter permease [Parasporobacterium sp.]
MTAKHIASNTWKTLVWPVAIFVVFFVLIRIFNPASAFGNLTSLNSILNQGILSALIAMAMTCNMLNDRWDFSMGIICVTTSFIVSPIVTKYELGSWGLLLLCVVVCVILCLINAGLYLLIRVPMLVISIGLLMVYETLNRVINNGQGAKLAGNVYTLFGKAPWIYILAFVVFMLFLIIFTYTKFGYNVRALGNNQAIANNIGVNETKNVVLSYILCGVILGVAACVNASMKGNIEASSTFNNNMGMMFTAFPAVFIGLYLYRYTNITWGIFVGAICIAMMKAGVLALGLPAAVQDIGVGAFLFFFIALTTNQGRFLDWSARRTAMKMAKQQK